MMKVLLHASYLSPFFCLSLWIRPLSSDMVAEKDVVNFFGTYDISYESFRVLTILGVCLFEHVKMEDRGTEK